MLVRVCNRMRMRAGVRVRGHATLRRHEPQHSVKDAHVHASATPARCQHAGVLTRTCPGMRMCTRTPKRKSPPTDKCCRRAFEVKAGDVVLSHTISRAVPSALRGLTTVFGMGTGVALAL